MHYKAYKSILSPQNGMNLYRGCTHGCIYCDSRSKCYQIQHPFEDIEIKTGAIQMLEAALRRKREKCMIAAGSMTDPYMPLEKEVQYTRRALELIDRYGFGVTLITKSDLVLRDIGLLERINRKAKAVVQMTLTTFDEDLCKKLEPGAPTTRKHFEALLALRERGIPTVVWLCPLLPFINDTEENLRGILDYCFAAGVWGILHFGVGLTLREGNREYFYEKLDALFPGLKEKYQAKYGDSYVIQSDNHTRLMKIFYEECKKHGVVCENDRIFTWLRTLERHKGEQLEMF